MKTAPWVLTAALLLSCATTAVRPPSLDTADALLRDQRWAEAEAQLEKLVEADPGNGDAWFRLGVARHRLGLYESAIEAGLRAAGYPWLRATSELNVACAHARMNRLEESLEALARALDAGFFDAGALAEDPDLEAARSHPEFPTLAAPESHGLDLGDGSVLPHTVLAPTDHPVAAVLLTPGLTMGELEHAMVRRGWTIIGVGSPTGGPMLPEDAAHLAGLLDAIDATMPVTPTYHMLGRGRAGITAFHVVLEMPERFTSLTVAPGYPEHADDADRLHRLVGLRVRLYVGGRDTFWLDQARWTYSLLHRLGVDVRLEVAADDDHALTSLAGGELADALDRELREDRVLDKPHRH